MEDIPREDIPIGKSSVGICILRVFGHHDHVGDDGC